MIARARIVAELDERGLTRLTTLRSEPPLTLRATSDALYLVSSAAGPLGGDDLALSIEVHHGAQLSIRSAAASVALPGPSPSKVAVQATVGRGASLSWLPEPLIAAGECRHQMTAHVQLAGDAQFVWREELLLGRHDEAPGTVTSRLVIDLGGHPLLRHELGAGPGHPAWASSAVGAGARACGSMSIAEPAWSTAPPPALVLGPTAAVLPLAGPAAQVIALADDGLGLRRFLDAGWRHLTPGIPRT